MVQQLHLFEKSISVERITSFGTTLRLKLEPLQDEQVKIIEFWRKAKNGSNFRRMKAQEGQVLAFEALGLEQSFAEVFELKEAEPVGDAQVVE